MATSSLQRTIEAVWRMESARLIAHLTRVTGDVGTAEDLAQEALLAAIQQWPTSGVPNNPPAWLTATAKHRATDHLRRRSMLDLKHDEVARETDSSSNPAEALVDKLDDAFGGDDVLRLIFIACHPVLSSDARAALTLRLLGGLTTDEIARAFLVPEPTIAQRIVRAKKTLAENHIPFEVPRGEALTERLASVLEVVYLIFNEGYSATMGDDLVRPALCEDALRLGRMLCAITTDSAEAQGLLALMEFQASRLHARVDEHGQPVLLMNQNRARWDRLQIQRGVKALDRAIAIAGGTPGKYTLQAAIAACHATSPTAEATPWPRIASLYEALSVVTPSPVIELNRAMAISMAHGPAAALPLVDALVKEGSLDGYSLLFSARADLLEKLGRAGESAAAFEKAATLTQNARERSFLLRRAAQARTGARE